MAPRVSDHQSPLPVSEAAVLDLPPSSQAKVSGGTAAGEGGGGVLRIYSVRDLVYKSSLGICVTCVTLTKSKRTIGMSCSLENQKDPVQGGLGLVGGGVVMEPP